MRTMTIKMLGVLLCGLLSVTAVAHRGHGFGNPFHDVTLEEARALATQEFKLVYVYVTAPDGRAPAYLEQPTWNDWQTIDLLICELVAVKLDSRRHAAELRQYQLADYPVMLVIDPNGGERQRLPGDLPADQLVRELTRALSDEDAVARVRAAVVAGNGTEPLSRERLAAVLARHGDSAGAVEQYLWCLTEGLRNIPYATARRRLMLKGFVALAGRYPPAREALLAQRERLEKTLRTERNAANLARNLAELNRCLDDEKRTLALYDKLPPRSRARRALFDRVIDQLVRNRRYDEVLDMVEPLPAFNQEIVLARQRGVLRAEGPTARFQRGTLAFAVARGVVLVEALAGKGRTDEARALIDRILHFDDQETTRELLKEHVKRTESEELLHYLEAKSATTQPARKTVAPASRRWNHRRDACATHLCHTLDMVASPSCTWKARDTSGPTASRSGPSWYSENRQDAKKDKIITGGSPVF